MTKLKILCRYSNTRKKWLVVRAISEDELRARRSKSAGEEMLRNNRYAQFGISGAEMDMQRQALLNHRARILLDGAGMAQAAHGGLGGVGALHGLHIPPE